MFFRQLKPGQIADVAFDFHDFLQRNGYPAVTLTALAAAGLAVLRTEVRGSVITLTVQAGPMAAGLSFMVGARAEAGEALSDSQFRLIYVRGAPVVEPIVNPGGVLYLVDDTGALLVDDTGAVLFA